MSENKYRTCPHCGSLALANHDPTFMHDAMNTINDGFRHVNAVMLGFGVGAACVQLFKKFRLTCPKCQRGFFSM